MTCTCWYGAMSTGYLGGVKTERVDNPDCHLHHPAKPRVVAFDLGRVWCWHVHVPSDPSVSGMCFASHDLAIEFALARRWEAA